MYQIKQIPVSIEHENLTDQQTDSYPTVAQGTDEKNCLMNLLDAINYDHVDIENNYLYLHISQG